MKNTICRILFALVVCLPILASAQVQVAPFINSRVQLFNGSGAPCSGCLLSTLSAGTTTPLAAYSDSAGSVPLSNPVVLDSSGSATIYLSNSSYKFVLKTSLGATIWTQDNVTWNNLAQTINALALTGNATINSSTAATNISNQSGPTFCHDGNYWTGTASAVDAWCFGDVLGTGTNPTSTLSITHSGSSGTSIVSLPATTVSSLTVSGALSLSGAFNPSQIDNKFLIDGTKYPLTVAGVQQAITDACTATNDPIGHLPQGGELYLAGPVTIPATTGVSQIFLVPCNIAMHGFGGQYSIFSAQPGTTSTIPFFRIAPTGNLVNFQMDHIQLQATGAATGGDFILIDSSAGGAGLSSVLLDHVITTAGAINGFDINTTGTGSFQALWTVEHSILQNGVKITNVADSALFFHNEFRTATGSTHACMEVTTVAGAAHFTILNNNMSCDGGEVLIHGSIQPKILYNQIEHTATTNKPAIYLQADSATINGAEILGNNLNCHTNALDCIKLGSGVNTVNGTRIEGNTITPVSTAGGNGITITASGTHTKIGPNIMSAAGNLQMSDGGDHTNYYANDQNGILSKPGAFFFAPADGVAALTLQRNSATQSVPILGINNEGGGGLMVVDQAGRVQGPNGSAANPAYSFLAHPNVGIYDDGVGDLGVAIAGSAQTLFANNLQRNVTGYVFGFTPSTTGVGSDVNITRNQAGILQIGTGETANASGGLKLNSLQFGANQALTFPPQLWQSGHLDNTVSLNSPNTIITWTPLAAVTLKRIDATITGNLATCTVAPKIRVTDGTTTSDLSIPSATTSFSTTFTQNYAAVPLSITTIAGTCSVNPQGINVTATFLSQ